MTLADVEARTMDALRAAGEPVREAVLYERVVKSGAPVDRDHFLGVMEHLATAGHVRVTVDHDGPARDPEPFGPRYWSVVR